MKNLPEAIQNPFAVFDSATQDGSFVVLTEISHNEKNFIIAIEANRKVGKININSIRSVHYRNSNVHIANWINNNLTLWANQKRMSEWFSKQQYNSADEEGALEAFLKYQKGTEELKREVVTQIEEIFGKKLSKAINDLRTVNNKFGEFYYTTRKGEIVTCPMTNDELLYIYALSKMEDVRPKLKDMNMDDAYIERIKDALDPRYIKFAD